MKKVTKTILGFGAVAILSAAVSGLTVMSIKDNTASTNYEYSENFKQSPLSGNIAAVMSPSASQPCDLTYAADKSIHAVVHIKSTETSKTKRVRVRDPFEEFFGDFFGRGAAPREREYRTPGRVGIGSGVIISTDGYIVTNNHVVAGADEISVRLNDNREFQGRVIGTDPSTDLALIKVEAVDLPAIVVGDSESLKVGEWVLAVGNPFNLTSTVTAGIVSAKARTLGVYNNGVESFIQTDAAINQGNSGGALVNTRGELIGINAVLSSPTGAYAGYGFAIPTSIMTKVVTDLKKYGSVQRAVLGIRGGSANDEGQTMSDDMKKKFDELGSKGYGVFVSEVMEGGSAFGKLKENDIILEFDGHKLNNFASMQEQLAKHRPGDKVTLKVLRDKKEIKVKLTLMNSRGNTEVVQTGDLSLLGGAFRELPEKMKRQLNLASGIEVTGVKSGKMKDAGIRKGFIILKVNGQMMRTVDDFDKAFKQAQQTPEMVLFMSGVYPSGKRMNYAVGLD